MTLRHPFYICVALVIGISSAAYGLEPMEALKVPIDQVVSILKDPQYQDPARKHLQREKLWEIMPEVFDFSEISRRTLARNWKLFKPDQKQAFTDLFTDLLGNTYLDKIQSGYRNEKVVFLNQQMLSTTKAMVNTKIIKENVDIPTDYSMRLRNGIWKVYDVRIEGVSLVKNYRTQFKKILFKESPAQLIERLKKKTEEQKKKRELAE